MAQGEWSACLTQDARPTGALAGTLTWHLSSGMLGELKFPAKRFLSLFMQPNVTVTP